MTRFQVLLLITAAWAGCGGPDSTVQGTVTIDGQLARRGSVVFHPVGGGPAAYGSIDDKGSYALRIGQGEATDANSEIDSGEYIVTAVVNMPSTRSKNVADTGPPDPGARITAQKYANKETSDLRVTIKSGPNVIPLELESASAEDEGDADGAEPAEDAEDADQSSGTEETPGQAAPPSIPPPAATADDDSAAEAEQSEATPQEPAQ